MPHEPFCFEPFLQSTLSRGNFPNYVRLAITRSGANLDPGINDALAKSIAASLHRLVQAAQHEPCRRRITATMGPCHDCIVRPATRNSISVQRGKRETPRVVSMKTECFAHIDALRSSISCPHQEFSFLATSQAPFLRCPGRRGTARSYRTGCRLIAKLAPNGSGSVVSNSRVSAP